MKIITIVIWIIFTCIGMVLSLFLLTKLSNGHKNYLNNVQNVAIPDNKLIIFPYSEEVAKAEGVQAFFMGIIVKMVCTYSLLMLMIVFDFWLMENMDSMIILGLFILLVSFISIIPILIYLGKLLLDVQLSKIGKRSGIVVDNNLMYFISVSKLPNLSSDSTLKRLNMYKEFKFTKENLYDAYRNGNVPKGFMLDKVYCITKVFSCIDCKLYYKLEFSTLNKNGTSKTGKLKIPKSYENLNGLYEIIKEK